MDVNVLPRYDAGDNPTNCCPRFHPEGWDGQDLHFRDKRFVRATTVSAMHIPLNMAQVFKKTSDAIEAVDGYDMDQVIILSRDLSPWKSEHLFAVNKDVPGEEMVSLTGDYVTEVFEGPFKDAPKWMTELEAKVAQTGKTAETTYFFYTTCPKCAKAYGKNYVVGVAQVA